MSEGSVIGMGERVYPREGGEGRGEGRGREGGGREKERRRDVSEGDKPCKLRCHSWYTISTRSVSWSIPRSNDRLAAVNQPRRGVLKTRWG